MQHNPAAKNYSSYILGEHYFTESKALFITNTLRSFAEAVMGIYIPIFIYQSIHLNPLNISNEVSRGVINIFLFYGLKSLVALILLPSVVDLIFGKLNFKGSIVVGNILLGVGLFSLFLAPNNLALFLPISIILLSVNSILYWIPYHTYFIRKSASSEGRYGKNVGLRVLLSRIASMTGPLIGAMLISFSGFESLFLVGLVILLFAGLPLVFSNEEHKHGKHNAKQIFFKYIKNNSLVNDSIAFAAMGVENVFFAIMSPLLIFFISSDIAVIGIITSFSMALSTVLSFKIGKAVDSSGPYLLHKIGVTLNTTLYVIRAFASTPSIIYTSDFLDRLNNSFFSIPFLSSMYMHAKLGKHETDFVIYRTYIIELAVLIGMVFAVIFIWSFNNWQYLFLCLACITPLTYAINLNRNIIGKGSRID